jgi:hypothetical protein
VPSETLDLHEREGRTRKTEIHGDESETYRTDAMATLVLPEKGRKDNCMGRGISLAIRKNPGC